MTARNVTRRATADDIPDRPLPFARLDSLLGQFRTFLGEVRDAGPLNAEQVMWLHHADDVASGLRTLFADEAIRVGAVVPKGDDPCL